MARAIRLVVFVFPVVLSFVVAVVLSRRIVDPDVLWVRVVRWVAIGTVAMLTMTVAQGVMRRLLPLAALFSLTLVFPDETPSRFGLALRGMSARRLERQLTDIDHLDLGDTPTEAAESLLELVALLSRHDRLTRGHSERVRAYAVVLGEEMELDAAEIDHLRWAALLHDVGKLHVPAEILNKPDALTPDEFETIKQHTTAGRKMVAPLAPWLGESANAVYEHHERWSGGGYPTGVAASELSLTSRIVSVADAFDVMTSPRSYRSPMSAKDARAELQRCAGTQFDPKVVRAMMNISLGRLWRLMGPLAVMTQLSLFPRPVVQATASATTGATSTAATAVAALVLSGAAIVVDRTGDVQAESAIQHASVPAAVVAEAFRADGALVDAANEEAPQLDLAGGEDIASASRTTDSSESIPTVVSPPRVSTTTMVAVASATVPPATLPPVSAAPTTTAADPVVIVTVPPASEPTVATAVGTTTTTPEASVTATTIVVTTPPTAVRTVPPTTAPSDPATSTTPGTAPVTTTASPESPPAPTSSTATTLAPATVVSSTSTSLAPTTSTQSPSVFMLAASGVGDQVWRPILDLAGDRPPLNPVLPNYDTDRDAEPGLTIQARPAALRTRDPAGVQVWRFPKLTRRIEGSVRLDLHVAPIGPTSPGQLRVRAGLFECDLSRWFCKKVVRDTLTLTGEDGVFAPVTFDLTIGPDPYVVTPGRRLELRYATLMGPSNDSMIAFDAVDAPSRLVITPPGASPTAMGPARGFGPIAPTPFLALTLLAFAVVLGVRRPGTRCSIARRGFALPTER